MKNKKAVVKRKGKKYIGYRFVPYTEKSKEGLVAVGYRIEPVYKCLPKRTYEVFQYDPREQR